MSYYRPNPACRCGRCSTHGLLGPAVLVTIGVLFLLANMGNYPFERTWPILLIVFGAIKVVRYVLPESGHVNPGQYAPPYMTQSGTAYHSASPNPAQPAGTIVTPPPAPIAGALGSGEGEKETHNG